MISGLFSDVAGREAFIANGGRFDVTSAKARIERECEPLKDYLSTPGSSIRVRQFIRGVSFQALAYVVDFRVDMYWKFLQFKMKDKTDSLDVTVKTLGNLEILQIKE